MSVVLVKYKQMEQKNTKKSPEMDSRKYGQLLYDKTVQAIISIGIHGSHHILKIAHNW